MKILDADTPSADRPFSMAVHDYFGKSRLRGWRLLVYDIIFESDTPLGRAFDIGLILVIVASVVAVMLESVGAIRAEYGRVLFIAEWAFTVVFSIEYVLRMVCVGRPLRYARSFFGLVDLMAVVPTYLSVLFPGAQYFLVIRLLRILRVFRVLKLAAYLTEVRILLQALHSSRRKIQVFLIAVLTLVVILGSLMYLVEGAENGFTSIPRSVYWAIVTLTTVGYGDISPQTDLGQAFAAMIMIIGYGILAVPTGIVTAELALAGRDQARAAAPSVEEGTRSLICPRCYAAGHADDARFCKNCGARL